MNGETKPDYLAFAKDANLDERVVRLIEQLAGIGRIPWSENGDEWASSCARDLCEFVAAGSLQIETVERLAAEQIALEQAILAAFRDVTCEGGVTHRQTRLLDDRAYTDEQFDAVGREDRERTWIELIDSPDWCDDSTNWAFYDAIGLRFYFPVGMVRSVRARCDESLAFTLAGHSKVTDEFFSILTAEQRAVIARYVRFMIAMDEAYLEYESTMGWVRQYERFWARFDRAPESH